MVGSPLYRGTCPSLSLFLSLFRVYPSLKFGPLPVALYSLIDFDHPFFGISECLRLGTNIEKAKNFDDA